MIPHLRAASLLGHGLKCSCEAQLGHDVGGTSQPPFEPALGVRGRRRERQRETEGEGEGDGRGRWRDGEMERWRDGEMERRRDGEVER